MLTWDRPLLPRHVRQDLSERHGGHRFILPVLPIAHIYTGYFLNKLSTSVSDDEVQSEHQTQHKRGVKRGGAVSRRSARVKRILFCAGCAALVLTHAGMAYYFSFWHQRSPIDVMHFLRAEAERLDDRACSSTQVACRFLLQLTSPARPELDVFFLMPCHSTPFYAYVHRPIPMDFVRCLPPIKYDGYEGHLLLGNRDVQKWIGSPLVLLLPP